MKTGGRKKTVAANAGKGGNSESSDENTKPRTQ
jgi:hypothetical protein